MVDSPIDPAEELTVTFQPPLALQRRGWVFDILRREHVSEILDIGCGEGELISCLCNAPPWLPPPPSSILPPSKSGVILPSPPEIDRDGGPAFSSGHEEYISVKRIHALDISDSDLEFAQKETAPRPASEPGSWHRVLPRWEELDVSIWKGSLDVYNPQFVDIECIISTEVIEHLSEDVLSRFAPMLLGAYHPRLLVITTPSFTFNERFVAPDAPLGTRKGYPDPTGRTNRVFRHDDHKFEWTVDEFSHWCRTVAEEWGYDVDISGVGKSVEADPWGRDERLGFASQVAAFTRREGEQASRRRQLLASKRNTPQEQDSIQHELLVTHHHAAHTSSQNPGTLRSIGNAVKTKMQEWQESETPIRQFWFEEDISTLCGGWVELLVAAVEEHPELQLVQTNPEGRWFVNLPGLSPNASELWGENAVEDIESLETSSVDTISVPSEDGDGWNQGSKTDSDFDGGWVSSEQPSGSQEDWSTSGWSENRDVIGWGHSGNDSLWKW